VGLGAVLRGETEHNDFSLAIIGLQQSRFVKQGLFSPKPAAHKQLAIGVATITFVGKGEEQ